jgi:GNAT superfamily N-acetyltransferase
MSRARQLSIREVETADLAAVVRLVAQMDDDGEAEMPLDQAREILERIKRYPDYTLYLAERAGRVVGTFGLLVMDKLAHGGKKSAIVEDVVVAPEARRTGVGKAMMEFARSSAAERGCYKISLTSNAKRERAHAFYESLGFRRHGYSFYTEL